MPLENVSERKTKWTHAVRTTATNFRNYKITKKNEPPGRNLEITLKINKWALLKETACNKMKSTTYPYHVVKFEKLGSLFARCVCFEKLNKSDLPLSTARASPFPPRYLSTFPQRCQPHPSVPNLAASTFTFGALSWRHRE
jgi:hypothetical protein